MPPGMGMDVHFQRYGVLEAHACRPTTAFRLDVSAGIRTVAGVQQHTDRGTKGLRRDVVAELRAHHTVAAVCPGNTAPDHTVLAAAHLSRGLVDVGNALMLAGLTHLAEVELSVLRALNALNLDERHVGVAEVLAAPVTQDPALAVETSLRG